MSDKPEPDEVNELVARLNHANSRIRQEAMLEIEKSKDIRLIKPLLRILEEKIYPDSLISKVKSRVAIALSKIGERAVPALIDALANAYNNPESSYWIINALGLIKDENAIEPLLKALRSPQRAIRGSAIEALGRIGNPKALESLIKAFQTLSPQDGYLYFAAAESLGYIGGERALHILEEALVNLSPESGYAYDTVNNAIQRIQTKQTSSE